jgi:hypothetical protein
VVLGLFFTFWLVELVLFPVIQPGRLLPWVMAFFYCAPFLMLAIGKLMNRSKSLMSWRPSWSKTSHLRRWFRTQYSIGFSTLTIVSFLTGNYFLALGFAIMVPLFIAYNWLLESKVSITESGVATWSGVLTWDAISEIKLFPRDKVLVLTVGFAGRYLIPYGIYHIPKPWKVKEAIEKGLAITAKGQDKA